MATASKDAVSAFGGTASDFTRWLEPQLGHVWAPSAAQTLDVEAIDIHWTLKAAKAYPAGEHTVCSARVTDQEIKAAAAVLPDCCTLQKVDIRQGLQRLPDQRQDHIRLRVPLLWSDTRPTDWSQVIAELCRLARPGARIDVILPADIAPVDSPATSRLLDRLHQLRRTVNGTVVDPTELINAALRRVDGMRVYHSAVAVPVGGSSAAQHSTSVGVRCLRRAWESLSEALAAVSDTSQAAVLDDIRTYCEALDTNGGRMLFIVWRATLSAARLQRDTLATRQQQRRHTVTGWEALLAQSASTLEHEPGHDRPTSMVLTPSASLPVTSGRKRHSILLPVTMTRRLSKWVSRKRANPANAAGKLGHRSSNNHNSIRRRLIVPDTGEHVHDGDTLDVAMQTALQGTHAVELEQPQRILSLAAGTGLWIKTIANRFVDAECTGVDVDDSLFVHHQPLPDNCRLVTGNPVKGLEFTDNHFDFIYQRDLSVSCYDQRTLLDWPGQCRELFRMLCCHGQLEVIETSLFTTGPGAACQQLNEWLGEMNARHTLGLNRAATLASVLSDAGFAAITRTVRRLRIGKHAGLEGTCTRRYYLQRLALLHDQLTAVESGSDMDRFAQLLQNWDRECQTGQQVQLELYCYTARKLPPRSVIGHESSSHAAQPVSSTISTASSTISSSVHSLVDVPRRHSTLGRRVKRGLASLRGTLRLSSRDAPPTPRTIHRHHRSRLHLNSDKEQMRMSSQHSMLLHFLGTLHMAPVSQPTRVLDMGTGTASWAKDMAQEYPLCTIHGCDYDESIMPSLSIAHNCSFQYGDILSGLPYPDGFFDYVYQRHLLLGLPAGAHGWPVACAELLRILTPNGLAELVETDYQLRSVGPTGERLNDWLRRLADHHALPLDAPTKLPRLMQRAGFQRVHDQVLPCPLGEWGGRIGAAAKENYRIWILGLVRAFSAIGVSKAELRQALTDLERETEQTKGFLNIHVCWGYKDARRAARASMSVCLDKPLPSLPSTDRLNDT